MFGPVSPSPTRLWSCAGSRIQKFRPSQRASTLSSGPLEALLDQDRRALVAEGLPDEDLLDRGLRLGGILRDDHTLARAEAGRLHDAAVLARRDERKRLLGVGEGAGVGGRHARGAHDLLGERLVPLELRTGARRPEDDAPRRVGELRRVVGRERRLGTDDDEADLLPLAPAGQSEHVADRLGAGRPEIEEPRVRAGLDPEPPEPAALAQLPGEGVLAAAGSEEEDMDLVGAAELRHGGGHSIAEPC